MSISFLKNLVLMLFLSSFIGAKPIIGIYGNPYPVEDYEKNTGDSINGAYVRWLESFGAEIVAIHQWYSVEEIDELLSKVNGVLFQGGDRIFHFDAKWEVNGKHILEYAQKTGLPLWATCLGFELICELVAGEQILELYNDSNNIHGAIMTDKSTTCKMYSEFTTKDFDTFVNGQSTIYNHIFGVSEEKFMQYESLTSLFDITSFALDKDGKKFVNSIESKVGNIFATQYHPEKNPYIRRNYILEHGLDSLRISQKIGMSFMKEVMKNKNRMNYEERMKYDFVPTYEEPPKETYDLTKNTYYYHKKETVNSSLIDLY